MSSDESRGWAGFRFCSLVVCAATVFLFFVDRLASWLNLSSGDHALTTELSLTLIGIHAVAQLIIFSAIVVIWFAATRSFRFFKNTRVPQIGAVLSGLVGVIPLYFTGRALARGDWISAQSYSWVVHWGFVLIGTGGCGILGWLLLSDPEINRSNAQRKIIFNASLLGIFVIGSLVDITLLPDLYPEFHLLVYGGCSTAICLVAMRLIHFTPRKRIRLFVDAAASLCFLLLVTSLVLFGRMGSENRATLLTNSRYVSRIYEVLLRASTNEYLEAALTSTIPDPNSSGQPVNWPRHLITADRDSNVLLLIIDALRADAVPPVRKTRKKYFTHSDTPFMNEWTKSNYRFHVVYSNSSTTVTSVPALFRSVWAYENFTKSGISLPEYMKRLKKKPVAVVNDFFAKTPRKSARSLLNGFEEVVIYRKTEMQKMVPLALNLLSRIKNRPFFAWIHMYCLHDPGFADGRTLNGKDGYWAPRYRRSLIWLDGELKKLFDGMERMKLLDKTVVVLASDHGESLGAHGTRTHGEYIFEEEVRVPLQFRIPGHPGGDVRQPVGNIDIVPTLADLLGAPKSKHHRGVSLVPLMIRPRESWHRVYYLQNKNKKIVGIVKNREKLIYHPRSKVFFRYDLRKDRREKVNLFGQDVDADNNLIKELIRIYPKLFERHHAKRKRKYLTSQKNEIQ